MLKRFFNDVTGKSKLEREANEIASSLGKAEVRSSQLVRDIEELKNEMSWAGRRSTPCHTGTLTEKDLQQHIANNFPGQIKNRKQAKEVLDCIENYFIGARKQGLNAVWSGWFTQLCMRSSRGKDTARLYYHKPFREMLKGLGTDEAKK